MGHYRKTFRIEAPLDQLWELMNDPERLPEWNRAFDRVDNATGRLDEVGTTYTQVMRVAGIELKGEWEITAVEAPRSREFQGKPPGMSYCTGRELFEESRGGTDYTVEMDYKLIGGPVAPLIDRIVGRSFLSRVVDGNIKALRQVIKA